MVLAEATQAPTFPAGISSGSVFEMPDRKDEGAFVNGPGGLPGRPRGINVSALTLTVPEIRHRGYLTIGISLSEFPTGGSAASAGGIVWISQAVRSAGRIAIIAAKLGVAATKTVHPSVMMAVVVASRHRCPWRGNPNYGRCRHDHDNLFHQFPPLSPRLSTRRPMSGSSTHFPQAIVFEMGLSDSWSGQPAHWLLR